VVPGIGQSQAFNRYAYTSNNPINYNDPSGHDVCNEDGYCFGPYKGRYRNPNRKNYDRPIFQNQSSGPTSTLTSTPQFTLPTMSPFGIGLPTQQPVIHPQPSPTATPQARILAQPSTAPLPTQPSPNPSSSPTFSISVDWNEVDYVDLTVDIVGIAGDVALVFVEPGPGVIIDIVSTSVELAGGVKTLNEVTNNDFSGVNGLARSVNFDLIKDNLVLIARFGRAAPIVGVIGNLYSIYDNLKPQINY
jgi:hypothetical protein